MENKLDGVLPAVRYTQDINNQPGRENDEMKRPYYVAGEKINGSVIQHAAGSEIMVVDFERDKYLKEFCDKVASEYYNLPGFERASLSLPAYIQQQVEEKVKYYAPVVDRMVAGSLGDFIQNEKWMRRLPQQVKREDLERVAGLGPLKDGKVYLGTYIKIGLGVCRQQGAIVAACLERLIDQGKAIGWKGVEIRANLDIPGGHLWAVALDEDDKEQVFDPAQHHYGSAESGKWNYRRGYENHKFGVPNS